MAMTVNRIILVVAIVLVLLSSCFEKDKAVPPYPGTIDSIPYNIELYVSYFDLESDTIVKVHPADAWQLGFECNKEGWHIIVNGGGHWFVKNTQQISLETASDTSIGGPWLYDRQSAFPDSTAVGNWLVGKGSKKEVYLLGTLNGLKYTSIKQIIFLGVNDSLYSFFYHDIDNNTSDTIFIHKSYTANYVYYSFPNKKQLNLEPDKSDYDLIFGPYYDLATEFSITTTYLVRGVFINMFETTATLDSLHNYTSIDALMINGYQFSARRDVIGYNWKSVSVDFASGGATYKIKNNYTYVIHTSNNNYFKLHFLSYESGGLKGVPQFEYEQLK